MASEKSPIRIGLQVNDVRWLSDVIEDIDFAPSYQRKSGIWSKKNQQFLIDTIFNGYDVPKFYLADFLHSSKLKNSAEKRFAIIDGKQRIEAIRSFLNDEIELDDGFVYLSDPLVDLAGKKYTDIAKSYPSIISKFNSFELVFMLVNTNDEHYIRQLFIRLNASKSLVGAELRNAMDGKVPELIRDIADHRFFKDYVNFSTVRSQDRNLAAKLLLVEIRGGPFDTKKKQLDALVGQIEKSAESSLFSELQISDYQQSSKKVCKILDRMTKVFSQKDVRLSQSGQIPVFYLFMRDVMDVETSKVDRFFHDLHVAREINRARAKSGQPSNPDIDRFEFVSRSANDAGSIKQRYLFLTKWWRNGFA